MLGGRKVRSNKGKKRGSYKTRRTHHSIQVRVNSNGSRRVSSRKARSNKGKKRTPYGPRTGKTRSGKKFRGGIVVHCYELKDEKTCSNACNGETKPCKWENNNCWEITEGKVNSKGNLVAANEFSGFSTAVNTKRLREKCSL